MTGIEAREVRAFFLLAGLHGQLGGGEGGDVVLAGVGGGDVMAAAVGEVEAEGLAGTAEDGGFVGGDDVGGFGLGEVGDEDVVPDSGAVGTGDDVLGVEDIVLEVFVEYAGLDFDGGLAGLGGVFVVEEGLGGAGSDEEGVGEAEDPAKAMAKMLTMRTKERTPRPEARMAVTSLSAARRLRPSRMPTSTAIGMVKEKKPGRR